jgi:hypothetical protein
MAQRIRSAKSASDWDQRDLSNYNIRTEPQNAPAFFGMPDLPEPNIVDQGIVTLDADNYAEATTVEGAHFLFGLCQAMLESSQESTVDDYTMALLCWMHNLSMYLVISHRTKRETIRDAIPVDYLRLDGSVVEHLAYIQGA